MTTTTNDQPYYDNVDPEIGRNPYPAFKRLRDEAPLYYNEKYDFYALSRYDDVAQGLVDNVNLLSGRGATLELIQSGVPIAPGTVLFEDPPSHTIHRALLARAFTPKKVAEIDPQVRQFCVDILDPLVGAGGFDFVKDLGLIVPMRVIGMLLGIPWDQQEAIRDFSQRMRANERETGPVQPDDGEAYRVFDNQMLAAYVDWRIENPADDVVTELLNVEFDDEQGVRRTLTREELLMYVGILAAAGNETTGRLISFTAQLLADYPDQRRALVEDPALLPGAIEEVLRYEPPALQTCRYVARDIEYHGETVPEGSAMLLLFGSANRDERHHERPDEFDIHRKGQHFSLSFGPHYCLGANLARLEARVVFEEVLKRFPEWEIDRDQAKFYTSSTLRSWERLPVTTS